MNTSTFVFVFCAVAVGFTTGQPHNKFGLEASKCIETTGIDANIMETLHKTGGAGADEEVKCFLACLLKGLQVMTADGTVDMEMGKSQVPSNVPHRDNIIAGLDACQNEKGANECETAHAVFTCMHEQRGHHK